MYGAVNAVWKEKELIILTGDILVQFELENENIFQVICLSKIEFIMKFFVGSNV